MRTSPRGVLALAINNGPLVLDSNLDAAGAQPALATGGPARVALVVRPSSAGRLSQRGRTRHFLGQSPAECRELARFGRGRQ